MEDHVKVNFKRKYKNEENENNSNKI